MKSLCISLVLASALFALSGAVFFARSLSRRAESEDTTRGGRIEEVQAELGGRLSEVLGRLEALERRLARTERNDKARPSLTKEAGPSAPDGADSSAAEREADSKDEEKLLASALAGKEAGGLRSFVHQVIQEERQEREWEEQHRARERQRELEELSRGPYGKFNLRVNTMGKRLNLNDFQKQRYFQFLSDYSARFEEASRTVNRQDPEAYQAYRERKKQMQEEFDGLVIQSLTPLQAQEYQELPSFEKSGADAQRGMVSLVVDGAEVGRREAMERFFLKAGEPVDVLGGFEFPSPPPARDTGKGDGKQPGAKAGKVHFAEPAPR